MGCTKNNGGMQKIKNNMLVHSAISYLKSYSQYALNRPSATHASIIAADPSIRILRTFGMSIGNARNDMASDSSPGGEPMATKDSAREDGPRWE